MTPTLLLPPRYTEDSILLWRAALAAGWQVERVQGWSLPAFLLERELAIYGEPLFGATMAEAAGYALLEPRFDWLAGLPAAYLRRSVRFATLEQALLSEQPRFIKPADDKCFPARVYASGQEIPGHDLLAPATPVLLAEPVSWLSEYRCFVLDGQLVTLSIYARGGELAQAPDGGWPASAQEQAEATRFCAGLLQQHGHTLPPAVVVDIGQIEGRGWAVVEANPCWAAGFYGCDPALALSVIRRACVRRSQLSEADRAWALER